MNKILPDVGNLLRSKSTLSKTLEGRRVCERNSEGETGHGHHRKTPKKTKPLRRPGSATNFKKGCKQALSRNRKLGMEKPLFSGLSVLIWATSATEISDTKYPPQNQAVNLNPLFKLNWGFRKHNSSLCKFLPIKLTKKNMKTVESNWIDFVPFFLKKIVKAVGKLFCFCFCFWED